MSRLLAEHVVDDPDKLAVAVVGKAVIDHLAIAPGCHEIVQPQAGELLGNCRLAKRQKRFKFGYRAFAFRQKAQQNETVFVGDRFEEVAGVPRVVHDALQVGRQFAIALKFMLDFVGQDFRHGIALFNLSGAAACAGKASGNRLNKSRSKG